MQYILHKDIQIVIKRSLDVAEKETVSDLDKKLFLLNNVIIHSWFCSTLLLKAVEELRSNIDNSSTLC